MVLTVKLQENGSMVFFIKNDGYQTPIVINPYRVEGNIDINVEYLLAQSRLILNHYVIGANKAIVEDIVINKVDFQIDLHKHQLQEKYFSAEEAEEQLLKPESQTIQLIKFASSYIYRSPSSPADNDADRETYKSLISSFFRILWERKFRAYHFWRIFTNSL